MPADEDISVTSGKHKKLGPFTPNSEFWSLGVTLLWTCFCSRSELLLVDKHE